jgi:hypothetical protein
VFHDMGESFRDQQSMWRTTDSRRDVRMRWKMQAIGLFD